MIEYKKLSPHTGIEILGVDLSQPLAASAVTDIMRLFYEHCVVLFRNQHLDADGLVTATNQFGKAAVLSRPKDVEPSGHNALPPQIMLITNIREDGKTIGAHPDGEMSFHHDTIHRENPTKATLLYAREVPTYGGNTAFSNLFAAYDALPVDLKAELEGRQGFNAFDYISNTKSDAKAGAKVSHAIHPAIRTHDVTGRKAIYVDRLMTQHLVDVPSEQSNAVLDRVFDHIEQEEFIYEHVWQKGDLVMWDNASSVHARRDFPADQIRLMWRTTLVAEGRPF